MSPLLKKLLSRVDLSVLFIFIVLINLPYFQNIHLPRHDSMQVFELFHFFYSNLFFHGEIAKWMPYDSFGLQSNHEQLFALSAPSYLSMILGCLFEVKDVLFLYKLSILFEQIVLLLGIYLLSRLLFSSRITVFLICLASISTADWYYQINFHFRIYYLFPLACFFFISFFQKKQPEYLWLTGLTLISWVMGCPPYFLSLWIFVFSILGIGLFFQVKGIWRCVFKRSWSNVLLFLILLVICFCFLYHLKQFLTSVELRSRGSGGQNSLSMFLPWAGIYGFPDIFEWQFISQPHKYVGLLPLIFFVFSLIKVREKTYLAFLATTVCLLWLSFGGIFATLCYFFPGMGYYRHLGLTYRLLEILILICAGYGLDYFWSIRPKTKFFFLFMILAVFLFLADAFRITGKWLTDLYLKNWPLREFFSQITFDSFLFRLSIDGLFFLLSSIFFAFLYLAKMRRRQGDFHPISNNFFKGLLMIVLSLDLISFQYDVYKKSPQLSQEYQPLLYTLKVNPLSFQHQRLQEPVNLRHIDGLRLITRPGGEIKYTTAYSFLQFDPCQSQFETHIIPLGFSQLLKTRPQLDPDLLHVLGCYAPKLRLLTQTVFTDTVDETINLIRGMFPLYNTVVLRGVKEPNLSLQSHPSPIQDQEKFIEVKKFSANELILEVDIPSQRGAYLIYADSYHPGWKATINGVKTPIFEAYLAFKAIHLDHGKSRVRFFFDNGFAGWITLGIAVFGVVVSFLLLMGFLMIWFTDLPLINLSDSS